MSFFVAGQLHTSKCLFDSLPSVNANKYCDGPESTDGVILVMMHSGPKGSVSKTTVIFFLTEHENHDPRQRFFLYQEKLNTMYEIVHQIFCKFLCSFI